MPEFKRLYTTRFDGEPVNNPETNETITTMLNHRTHRVFATRPVEPEILEQILAATFSSPSKSDLQQATLIHIRSATQRAVFADLIPSMPWIRACPEFFVFCADGRRIDKICGLRDKPFANNNLDNLLAAVCDCGITLQAFITASESLGLGCCPISVIRDHMDSVANLLSLPDRVIPIAGMCLGYPDREGFVSMRLPLAATVHTDQYDDSLAEQQINEYDQARDARFSLPDDRQKYVKEFGLSEFYGWSEDKARQMAREERANVGGYVTSHGFDLGS